MTIYSGFSHERWQFSTAMGVITRGYIWRSDTINLDKFHVATEPVVLGKPCELWIHGLDIEKSWEIIPINDLHSGSWIFKIQIKTANRMDFWGMDESLAFSMCIQTEGFISCHTLLPHSHKIHLFSQEKETTSGGNVNYRRICRRLCNLFPTGTYPPCGTSLSGMY